MYLKIFVRPSDTGRSRQDLVLKLRESNRKRNALFMWHRSERVSSYVVVVEARVRCWLANKNGHVNSPGESVHALDKLFQEDGSRQTEMPP